MRLRFPAHVIVPVSLIASLLIPTFAGAVGTSCSQLKGKKRALCEINATKGRPIRRQVKTRARALIKEHRKAIENASTIAPTGTAGSSSSAGSWGY